MGQNTRAPSSSGEYYTLTRTPTTLPALMPELDLVINSLLFRVFVESSG